MSKRSFTFLISLLFSMTISAQIGAPGSASSRNWNDNEEIMNQFLKGIKKNADPSDNLDGTPYLHENFQPALLIFPENQPLQAQVRYNVAKEEMHVRLDQDGYRILHPDVIVKIAGIPYEMLTYRGEDKTIDLIGYFQHLTPVGAPEELKLLRKNLKTIKRGKAAAAMQEATPPRYVDKDDFYLQFGNHRPVLAEKRTKRFLEVFPEAHRAQVRSFMKDNKLKSRAEEDLKQIVAFYNRTF